MHSPQFSWTCLDQQGPKQALLSPASKSSMFATWNAMKIACPLQGAAFHKHPDLFWHCTDITLLAWCFVNSMHTDTRTHSSTYIYIYMCETCEKQFRVSKHTRSHMDAHTKQCSKNITTWMPTHNNFKRESRQLTCVPQNPECVVSQRWTSYIMLVCVCVYIYIYIHVYIHICIHTHT